MLIKWGEEQKLLFAVEEGIFLTAADNDVNSVHSASEDKIFSEWTYFPFY
jgi:hypothetical protein